MLQKIGTINEFHMNHQELLTLPDEVRLKIQEVVSILDEAYGSERDVMKSLGGFVQVLKTASEWKQFFQKNYIDKDQYEFVEDINSQYVYLLYVVSADYAIAVIIPKSELDIELRYE